MHKQPRNQTDRARMEVVRHRVTGLRQRGRLFMDSTAGHSRRLLTLTTHHSRQWLTGATGHGRTWLAALLGQSRQLLAETAATHRGRTLLATVMALLVVGVGAIGANVAALGGATTSTAAAPSPSVSAELDALADRDRAADRGDRGDRGDASPLADGPRESPTPRQSPQESGGSGEGSQEAQPDWVHPMPGTDTTSCFGPRWGVMHAGVDMAGPSGTPIQAVGAGTVTHAGWEFSGYGQSVVIDHGNGYYTHYAHASEVKVSAGDSVSPGQVIALEGSTGDSTGPHLHFEVHKDSLWNQVEPTAWMSNRGVDIPGC